MAASDEALFVELYTNPKIMRQIAEPLTPEQAAKIFLRATAQEVRRGAYLYWVIRELTETAAAGIAVLMPRQEAAMEAGIMLLPAYSRRQLAFQATACMIHYAFSSGLTELILATHQQGNLPVPHILRALQMTCIDEQSPVWCWQLEYQHWLTLQKTPPYLAIEVH